MFSNNKLGNILRNGRINDLNLEESPYLLVSLLLTELQIRDSSKTIALLNRALLGLYGNNAKWSPYAPPLPSNIIKHITEILQDDLISSSPVALAYLHGLLSDKAPLVIKSTELSRAVFQRQRRIFAKTKQTTVHNHSNTNNVIVCVLGLKGSGKTAILNELTKRGQSVLEVYSKINSLKQNNSPLINQLPLPQYWRDEPLRIAFESCGLHYETPPVVFVGSLLRHAEINYLNNYGKLVIVWINADNSTRHQRSRARGRSIEKNTSVLWLAKLDSHRDGLWPNYETNDVGGLICQSSLILENNKKIKIPTLVDQLQQYVANIQKG